MTGIVMVDPNLATFWLVPEARRAREHRTKHESEEGDEAVEELYV